MFALVFAFIRDSVDCPAGCAKKPVFGINHVLGKRAWLPSLLALPQCSAGHTLLLHKQRHFVQVDRCMPSSCSPHDVLPHD
jgi:hypothetical protein